MSVVIRVENLSKYYRLGVIGGGTLHGDLNRWWARVRGRPDPSLKVGQTDHGNRKGDEIWALRDVSFEVREGEILGVIGRNGAGKSTLLKILSRITAPTSGRALIKGRVGSLLEVGTGFHPELTGRENIYLNGAILGMSRAEIDRNFDEIVAFADVEKFLDTPVKRYSSGMYVRLAFAVAAHLEVDILLVDEILAVGDAVFQEKCFKKMDNLSVGGKIVLFVSHNISAVSRLCSRALVFKEGRLKFDDNVDNSIANYLEEISDLKEIPKQEFFGNIKKEINILSLAINGSSNFLGKSYLPSQNLIFCVKGRSLIEIKAFRITIALRKKGEHILSIHDLKIGRDLFPGGFESHLSIPPFLLSPGEYSLELGGYSQFDNKWIWSRNLGFFIIVDKWYPEYDNNNSSMGLINLNQYGERIDICSQNFSR